MGRDGMGWDMYSRSRSHSQYIYNAVIQCYIYIHVYDYIRSIVLSY